MIRTEQEWSAAVKLAFGNHCHWPVCYYVNLPIEAAHIIPRRYRQYAMLVENGIPLCVFHHRRFDSLSVTARQRMVKLLGRSIIELEEFL